MIVVAGARGAEADAHLRNAALQKNGGRVTLRLSDAATGKDQRTTPDELADGNLHTRCATWGSPLVYRIELIVRLPVKELNFITSDYDREETPKDIEGTLSDGTVSTQSLSAEHTSRKAPKRQTMPVGKDLEWIEVKVLSNHPNAVRWGGLGEIEVITTADLAPFLTVADYDPQAPVDVEGGAPRSDYSAVKVTVPTPIPLGVYPGIYMTHDEIQRLSADVSGTPESSDRREHGAAQTYG
jgi:hypothetical protein